MHPGSSDCARRDHRWIGVVLERVGAEEVGDDLLVRAVEQGGLGREEDVPDAAVGGRRADVVLRADRVTDDTFPASTLRLSGTGGGVTSSAWAARGSPTVNAAATAVANVASRNRFWFFMHSTF